MRLRIDARCSGISHQGKEENKQTKRSPLESQAYRDDSGHPKATERI